MLLVETPAAPIPHSTRIRISRSEVVLARLIHQLRAKTRHHPLAPQLLELQLPLMQVRPSQKRTRKRAKKSASLR